MKTILLKNIQKEYEEGIRDLNKVTLTAEDLITLSKKLFTEIIVKGSSREENDHNDMLLFQYGNYKYDNKVYF